eukprot:2264448-Pyramimonas_sp.AAC.1
MQNFQHPRPPFIELAPVVASDVFAEQRGAGGGGQLRQHEYDDRHRDRGRGQGRPTRHGGRPGRGARQLGPAARGHGEGGTARQFRDSTQAVAEDGDHTRPGSGAL